MTEPTSYTVKCRSKNADRCYSPGACGDFGYCRERNFENGLPDAETAKEWREEDRLK